MLLLNCLTAQTIVEDSEMSRVGDSAAAYHRLIGSPALSGLLLQSACSPSTSFAPTQNHVPTSTVSPATINSNPTTTIQGLLSPSHHHEIHSKALASLHHIYGVFPHPPPHYHTLFPPIKISEPAIDVVGDLTDSTREVSIQDKEEEKDQPLDLSFKKSPAHSPSPRPHLQHHSHAPSLAAIQQRPSVIIESQSQSRRTHATIRRSASSVSPDSDVHEHFRRSLSGKWPRKTKSEDEKARASPFRRHPSFHTPCTQLSEVVVSNTNSECAIEDHFRRALSAKEFEEWQRKRNDGC